MFTVKAGEGVKNAIRKIVVCSELVWQNLMRGHGECLTAVLSGFRMLGVGEGEFSFAGAQRRRKFERLTPFVRIQ